MSLAELRLAVARILEGANLSDACFIGADLTGADLSDAELDGADFTGAGLTDVVLARSRAAGAKGLP